MYKVTNEKLARIKYFNELAQKGELANITEEEGTGLKFPSGTHYLEQGFPTDTFTNTKYTVVLTLTNDTKYGGVLDLTSGTTATLTSGIFTFELKKNHNSTYDRFKITANPTANFLVKNVALYKGTFNALPTYQPKTTMQERLDCLRYFRRFNAEGYAGVTYSNSLRIEVPIDIAMRITTPTLIVKEIGTIRQKDKGTNGKITTVTPTIADDEITSSEVTFCVYSYSGTGNNIEETALYSNGAGAWESGIVGLEADFS